MMIILCAVVAIYANWFMQENKIIIPSCCLFMVIFAFIKKRDKNKL